jgi:hypothetical protein
VQRSTRIHERPSFPSELPQHLYSLPDQVDCSVFQLSKGGTITGTTCMWLKPRRSLPSHAISSAAYGAAESAYNYADLVNNSAGSEGPITVSNQYHKPYRYQLARSVRLEVHFTF